MSFRDKKLVWIIQIIFGLILIVFGLNFFFQFLPALEFTEPGAAFLTAIFIAGYLFPVMGVIFIIVGLLYIFHSYASLSTLILLPFTINMMLFHLFLDVATIGFALLLFIPNLYLIGVYWNNYQSIFKK